MADNAMPDPVGSETNPRPVKTIDVRTRQNFGNNPTQKHWGKPTSMSNSSLMRSKALGEGTMGNVGEQTEK